MMEIILHWDAQLFQYLNQVATHPWLDVLLPFLRGKQNWIPLYLLLAVWLVRQYKWQKGLWAIVISVLAIAVGDTLSSKVVKPLVERPRPCHEESGIEARLLVPCGGGYSFTSSHATNHFALAILFTGFFWPSFRHAGWFFLLWAGSISYAQVYVGLHYPLDVLGGAMLGMAIGGLMWSWFKAVCRGMESRA